MKVILAEKPSVAAKIAEVLGKPAKKELHYEVGNYIVCWARGHLVSLVMPDKYNNAFKYWNLKTLPIVPQTFKTEVIDSTDVKKLFNHIKEQLNRKDVDEIYCATDAGREGQLIFQLIYNQVGCKKPVKRLWFSSLEEAEIKRAFSDLKSNDLYRGYYESAIGRAKADWLVGMNLTRLYTLIYGPFSDEFKHLNVGRVQTPTLAMIVNRHNSIVNFTSKPYFELDALFNGFKAKWFNQEGTRLNTKKEAELIRDHCLNKDAVVEDVLERKITKNRPKLYYLTDLQRDAFTRFHFNPKQALNYAQSLYEKGLITYPRTDSPYLTEDFVDVLPNLLNVIHKKFPEAKDTLRKLAKQKLLIDNNILGKVSDHHAIIITHELENFDITKLDDGEMKILKLIVARMLVAVDRKYVYSEWKTIFKIDSHSFKHIARQDIERGWKDAYESIFPPLKDEDEEDLQTFLKFQKGDLYPTTGFEILEKETKPEKHFNYATILSAMENAGKKITDEELRETMKGISLGTEATRAGILDELIKNGYVYVDKKKSLIPTERGIKLIYNMVDALRTPDLTGKWEQELDLVKEYKTSEADFVKGIVGFVGSVIKDFSSTPQFIDKATIENAKVDKQESEHIPFMQKCPICGKGEIFENSRTYYCGQWKSKKCSFTLWKEDFGLKKYNIQLSVDDIKNIILGETVDVLTGGTQYTVSLEKKGTGATYKVVAK